MSYFLDWNLGESEGSLEVGKHRRNFLAETCTEWWGSRGKIARSTNHIREIRGLLTPRQHSAEAEKLDSRRMLPSSFAESIGAVATAGAFVVVAVVASCFGGLA